MFSRVQGHSNVGVGCRRCVSVVGTTSPLAMPAKLRKLAVPIAPGGRSAEIARCVVSFIVFYGLRIMVVVLGGGGGGVTYVVVGGAGVM